MADKFWEDMADKVIAASDRGEEAPILAACSELQRQSIEAVVAQRG